MRRITMRKISKRSVIASVFVVALAIAGAVLLTTSGSGAMGTTALAALVGGEITPACGLFYGVAAGLTIGGIVGGLTPVGWALGITGVVVGLVTYSKCG